MKIELIVVGKTVNKHFATCIDDYVSRINHYMPFSIVTIPELKKTKNITNEQQKQQEGENILKHIQPTDTVVLLDEHGKEYRSIELATWIEKKQHTARKLVLVRANELVSLSKMTFSHQMVRLILTEQLYRACTIIKGEPYHHE